MRRRRRAREPGRCRRDGVVVARAQGNYCTVRHRRRTSGNNRRGTVASSSDPGRNRFSSASAASPRLQEGRTHALYPRRGGNHLVSLERWTRRARPYRDVLSWPTFAAASATPCTLSRWTTSASTRRDHAQGAEVEVVFANRYSHSDYTDHHHCDITPRARKRLLKRRREDRARHGRHHDRSGNGSGCNRITVLLGSNKASVDTVKPFVSTRWGGKSHRARLCVRPASASRPWSTARRVQGPRGKIWGAGTPSSPGLKTGSSGTPNVLKLKYRPTTTFPICAARSCRRHQRRIEAKDGSVCRNMVPRGRPPAT
jgi:hypothetical protein